MIGNMKSLTYISASVEDTLNEYLQSKGKFQVSIRARPDERFCFNCQLHKLAPDIGMQFYIRFVVTLDHVERWKSSVTFVALRLARVGVKKLNRMESKWRKENNRPLTG